MAFSSLIALPSACSVRRSTWNSLQLLFLFLQKWSKAIRRVKYRNEYWEDKLNDKAKKHKNRHSRESGRHVGVGGSVEMCKRNAQLPQTIELKQTNSVVHSPQANYTDWTTAACKRNLVPTFVDRGVSRGQRGGSPTAVNLSFLDRRLYLFLSSSSSFILTTLSGPRSRHNDKQNIWYRRESNPGPWPLDHRGGKTME
jgi:hypothetical protein